MGSCWRKVNSSPPSAAYMCQWIGHTGIGSDNGLSPIRREAIIYTPMLGYCQLDHQEQTSVNFW